MRARALLLLFGLLELAPGQTPGISGLNRYTISGRGATPCGTVASFDEGPQVLTIAVEGPPGTMLVGGVAASVSCGGLPLLGIHSIDLDLGSTAIWFNWPLGSNPSGTLGNGGVFSISLSADLEPGSLASQWALLHPVFPGGLGTSNAISMTVAPVLCAGALLPQLGEDSTIVRALSTPFPFYGQSFDHVWINMNGNVTFCTGSADFTPTAPEMLSGPPRLAPCWDDFSPGDPNSGDIAYLATPNEVCIEWRRVRHFGLSCLTGDENTFTVTLRPTTGEVTFGYGPMSLCSAGGGTFDQVVGISPGGATVCRPTALPALGTATDLAVGGIPATQTAATPDSALFEAFSGSSPFDLANTGGSFLCFVPTGGPGIGPYAIP